MRRTAITVLLGLGLFLAGCGEAPPGPAETDGPEVGGPSPDALLVGTWDYAMRYPSGDEIAMVRVFQEDGTGRQYAKDPGEASSQSFTWEVTEEGKTLVLSFGEVMKSTYGILRVAEGEHVLTNAHGLEETSTKR